MVSKEFVLRFVGKRVFFQKLFGANWKPLIATIVDVSDGEVLLKMDDGKMMSSILEEIQNLREAT